jgi:hypothetical protein
LLGKKIITFNFEKNKKKHFKIIQIMSIFIIIIKLVKKIWTKIYQNNKILINKKKIIKDVKVL